MKLFSLRRSNSAKKAPLDMLIVDVEKLKLFCAETVISWTLYFLPVLVFIDVVQLKIGINSFPKT